MPVLASKGGEFLQDTRKVEDAFNELSLEMQVVHCIFDAESSYSSNRALSYPALMLVSRQQGSNTSVGADRWKESALWKGRCVVGVQMVGRAEMVTPTTTAPVDGCRGNLSRPQEMRQWVTGQSLYSSLIKAALPPGVSGPVLIIDLSPYDASINKAALSLRSDKVADIGLASVVWASNAEAEKTLLKKYIDKTALNFQLLQWQNKVHKIPGLEPPEPEDAATGSTTASTPPALLGSFRMTSPELSTKSLIVLDPVQEKWGKDPDLSEQFEKLLQEHNAAYNNTGKVAKRTSSEQDGSDSKKQKLESDDPQPAKLSLEDAHQLVQSKPLSVVVGEKEFLVCNEDSTDSAGNSRKGIYVHALADQLNQCGDLLGGVGGGEWQAGETASETISSGGSRAAKCKW